MAFQRAYLIVTCCYLALNIRVRSFHQPETGSFRFALRHRLGLGHLSFLVPRFVVALVFLPEVEGPVLVEIAARTQASQLQDGFGAFKTPARASDFHSIFDKISAGSFDDAGRYRIAFRQILVIV